VRVKYPTATLEHDYQVTAVAVSDGGEHLYTGGLDNKVRVVDLRKDQVWLVLEGHADTITSFALSPDSAFLLSNSMDNTLRVWDVRPFVSGGERCTRVLEGAVHNFEKQLLKCAWSPNGERVTAGSADRFVCKPRACDHSSFCFGLTCVQTCGMWRRGGCCTSCPAIKAL
jgi:Prp8 binding protein